MENDHVMTDPVSQEYILGEITGHFAVSANVC